MGSHLDVNDLIGIPFQMRGRDHATCDCWGLLRLVYGRVGIDLPAYTEEYQTLADKKEISNLMEGIKNSWRKIDVAAGEKERVTDAVLLKIAGLAFHVGCVVRPGIMLHTMEHTGSLLERYDTHEYKNRILGFYRHERLDSPAV